jgi:hypothetical protein
MWLHDQGRLLKTVFSRLFILLLLLPFLFSIAPVSPVSAALRSCRGDPKFFLSNGEIVTSTATISTDVANVSNANFILHAPKGLSLIKIVYTTKGSGIPETGSVVFDQSAGKYWLDVVVTTKVSGVAVIATGALKNGAAKTASGLNGQHLIIRLP